MLRKEHCVAAWIALAATLACGGRERGDRDSVPGAQGTMAAPQAPADAVRPNRMIDPDTWKDPRVRAAYAAANKYAAVLEHIYCYCHCKENLGHRALAECFESEHASMCDICMAEAMTVARMTEQGRTPAQIQKAIDAFYAS